MNYDINIDREIMDIKQLFSNFTKFQSTVDFNSVVKKKNLYSWVIYGSYDNKVKLEFSFCKEGIKSTVEKRFNTIMEAVEYFYNFLKTI